MQKKQFKKTIEQQALELHRKLKGKTKVIAKTKVTKKNYDLLYAPGVGEVSLFLSKYPEKTNEYTGRGSKVAIISDGSAVLGLGNKGSEAALPVMEAKALLFKEFGGVDAVPIVLSTQNTEEIVKTIIAIAPSFGGINLEDIASPKCFEIETVLKNELNIPVFHDDQHGTAIVVLAGLINAHKVVKKNIERSRIAIVGAGAAGIAISKLLLLYGVGDLVVVDSIGILSRIRTDLMGEKAYIASVTNNENRTGGILEAIVGADVVIGVSQAGIIRPEYVRMMAQKPIVFALANPNPEILPEMAVAAGAEIVATGRGDYPNQINNILAFPGIFKGVFENKSIQITEKMKIQAAKAIAKLVSKPTAKKIIPTVFDRRVAKAVAKAMC